MLIKVDRVTAGRLGVSMQDVNNTLYDAFGQRQISTIYGQSNQYRVVLEADPRYQTDPAALGSIYVPASSAANSAAVASGTGVQGITALSTAGGSKSAQVPLPRSPPSSGPSRRSSSTSRSNFRRPRSASIWRPASRSTRRVDAIAAAGKRIGLPSSDRGQFHRARWRSSISRSAASRWLILAALVVIYIVLGVLYESFIHPFTILTTLPSAGIGALLALIFFGMEFSFIALIGIVLLDGHREEERHHHDRLRAGGGAQARHDAGRGHPRSVPACVSAQS